MSQVESILHVENDPIDVVNVQRALARLELSIPVATARNGKEALELLRASGPDDAAQARLVLLDLGMPIMGGLEFLEELKADAALRAIPVVVLTASDRDEERRRAYELGVAGYVVKPLPFDEFVAAVDLVLRYWTLSLLP